MAENRKSWIKLFLEAKKLTSRKQADAWLGREAGAWAKRTLVGNVQDVKDLFRRNFAMLCRYYDNKTVEKMKKFFDLEGV
jgi:hypothetical protein